MPFVQPTQPTPSPPLHQPAAATTKSEKAVKRVRLDRATSNPSKCALYRSSKATYLHKQKGGKPKLVPRNRHKQALSGSDVAHSSSAAETPQEPLSAGPSLASDSPSSPLGWRYTGSPFHEQLRDEYMRCWLPWRTWVDESPPSFMMNNNLFLSERARAADWVEQMFESWFLAGYGCRKTRYEYPGMESD
ncbi:hypothetical protein CALVIDRAFT_40727 [Calocera viscosa TUFC12733]|uniref:Uncharacterized protein n=1 Tax=Calocera viscosa (strain TUFC12733) TaxID=1330018 RepID=A0A167P2G9_CALVF|nr:hypothetical protein CALVIDRAFT_40727 [Calocera viscosa TUFC12733]